MDIESETSEKVRFNKTIYKIQSRLLKVGWELPTPDITAEFKKFQANSLGNGNTAAVLNATLLAATPSFPTVTTHKYPFYKYYFYWYTSHYSLDGIFIFHSYCDSIHEYNYMPENALSHTEKQNDWINILVQTIRTRIDAYDDLSKRELYLSHKELKREDIDTIGNI